MAVDTSSAAAVATRVVRPAAAALLPARAAPMLSMSAATDPTVSGETSTYVIGTLAVPGDNLAISGNHRGSLSVSRCGSPLRISAEMAILTKIVFWQANWAR
jgi:hypothetical protein